MGPECQAQPTIATAVVFFPFAQAPLRHRRIAPFSSVAPLFSSSGLRVARYLYRSSLPLATLRTNNKFALPSHFSPPRCRILMVKLPEQVRPRYLVFMEGVVKIMDYGVCDSVLLAASRVCGIWSGRLRRPQPQVTPPRNVLMQAPKS